MRLRATILVKLLVALVLPVVALFTLFAFVAYEVSRRDLDDELGHRLEAIAASAATQIRGKYLVELAPGDEDERGVPERGRASSRRSRKATGAQLFVFDRQFDTRGDTAGDVAIGTHYYPRRARSHRARARVRARRDASRR